jgi:prolipoprotein diacylglyceryltransferase
MNKTLKYSIIALTGIVVALAVAKSIIKKRQPILDEELNSLIKRIDEAKK